MVRGCQKKVVHLKSTDSRLYDEVFFIVSDRAPVKTTERDFIDEANRIIRDSVYGTDTGSGIIRRIKSAIIPFVCGVLFSAAVCVLLIIIYK